MNDVKIPICMNFPIPQIIPHRGCKNLHFLDTPPQCARKQRKGHALCAPVEVFADPLAQLLVALVLGPRVDGPFGRCDDNVDETCAVHHVGHAGDCVERESGFVGAFVHEGVPAEEGGVWGQAAVVAAEDKVDVVDFEVAAGLEEAEALVNVAGPVFEGANHHLRVNVVEFAREGPLVFQVIDFEVEVWWDAVGRWLVLYDGLQLFETYLCG
jgi:hypothetical protein